MKARQINVETNAGVVQLSGFVTSAGMRERAAKIAAGVEGVKHVENALVIKPE